MSSKNSNMDQIPFFPSYNLEQLENVSVWWFERNFSQAKYGEHSNHGTNSCTVIAILIAEIIAANGIETRAIATQLPNDVIIAFGLGIIRGNLKYGKFASSAKLVDANLSIPEALKAAGEYVAKLQEWFYVHVNVPINQIYLKNASQKITTVLKDGLRMWKMVNFNKNYFFVIMIADSRSVLLCFQNNKCVTFFDSHFHTPQYGAVIAQTEKKNLFNLINWIIEMYVKIFHSKPDVFELSFIPVKANAT